MRCYMRTKAIQIMTELADAYAAIPKRHKEYILSHVDEIADAAIEACCAMEAMQMISKDVAKRIDSMTSEEIKIRNSFLREIAANIKE